MNNLDTTFKNLFTLAEHQAHEKVKSLDLYNTPCICLGELDCESDCINAGVPEDQVLDYFSHSSKPNVFQFKNGSFYLCNDFEANDIFENGNVVDYEDFYDGM